MAHAETNLRPYIMFVETPEQSRTLRLDFASSGEEIGTSSSSRENATATASLELVLGHHELAAQDPAEFHKGLMNFIGNYGRQIMVTATGCPEAIARCLASAAIPEEMKLTYPPLPELPS